MIVSSVKNSYWALFVLALAIVAFSALVAIWRRVRDQRLQSAGRGACATLATCKLLIQLVTYLQQHRGMSSAWLSGDKSFLARLQEKQTQIAGLLPKIKRLARQEGVQARSNLTVNQFSLFMFRWQCLLDELPHLTPEQGIARHNQSIGRLLEWLAAIGEARIEPLLAARIREDGLVDVKLGIARNFSQRLPMLTECLGQARAIGSSVAAKRTCTPVARVRLMFLIGRAEALLEQVIAAHEPGLLSRKCRQSIDAMASTVRTRMLLSTGVVVSATEYFALSTRAIDDVFEWIDVCAAEITRVLACPEQLDQRVVPAETD